MIRILAIGKKHETWAAEAIKQYSERLRAPWNMEWLILPHSSLEGVRARAEESERILARLKDDDSVILLDETGSELDSPSLTKLLSVKFANSKQFTIVIGGAYGVDDRVKARAEFTWSLSPLVFPHQLVRVILTEQLYRAQEIDRGSSYHHI